ncbi:uncharacterized protein LOC101234892 [Hydra vulgaris]|uniref:uncharacterized protein LOC101234892 n=1 Tax=Hydra vulgaris TaxID=6087 RepID=UPI0006411524|nr:uncharacterized protein LOC101234892 [Hydra vulgaris]
MKNRIITDLFIALMAFIICEAEKKYFNNSLVDFHLTSVNGKKVSKRNSYCLTLTKDELMSHYQSFSDYNPQYLAATIEEAVLFPNLLWDNKDIVNYMFIINELKTIYKKVLNPNDLYSILKFKNLVEKSLNLSMSKSTGVTTGNIRRTKERTIIQTKFCADANSTHPKTKLVQLCAQCTARTEEKPNWFPRYVNEIICGTDKQNNNGNFCFQNEGVCTQIMTPMKFLVKTNDCELKIKDGTTVNVEKWKEISKDIRTSCECRMFENSYIRKLM